MSRPLPPVALAGAMIVSPILIALGTNLTPTSASDATVDTIANVAAHRPAFLFAQVLDMIGWALLGVAAAGARRVITGRGSTLVTLGWLSATVGGVAYMASDLSYATVLLGASQPGQDPAAMTKLVDYLFGSPIAAVPTFGGWILGYAVGTLLIGIGVWRSRRGAAFTVAGILFIVSVLGFIALGPIGVAWLSIPFGELPFVVAYAILATHLLRAPQSAEYQATELITT